MTDEPGTFSFVAGGALRRIDENCSEIGDDLLGFLNIGHHSAHPNGEDLPNACLDLVEESPIGQFELYFCSTKCLRQYFNRCVDQLEDMLAAQQIQKE